jgi:hypothetical protein
MKAISPVLLLFLVPGGASAQVLADPSDSSKVTVIEKKWRVEVRNPALEEDPFRASNEHAESERDRKDTLRQNDARGRLGLPPVPVPNRGRAGVVETRQRGLSITYIYEVKVRNNAEKAIRTLAWDYVFFEPGTEQEVGRLRVISETSIGAGKTKNLVLRSASPPTGTIDATKVNKKSQEQYIERVVIQRIEYADGSVWEAPLN